MVARDARTDVELVEDDGDDVRGAPAGPHAPPGPPGAHRTRRRVLVAGGAVLAVLVVVGIVGQTVVSSRERARVATIAGLPGVVGVVDGPVRVLRSGPDDGVRRATLRTPAGLLVSSSEDEDGAASVRALDPTTGTVAWQADLIERGRALHVPPGGEVVPSRGSCESLGPQGGTLVCLADNGVSLVGRGTLTQVAPDVTRLLVLDARDGSVVADLSEAVDGWVSASLAVLGDLVVVAGAQGDGVHVRALAVDGTVAWGATFPSTTTTAFGAQVELDATADRLVVVTPDAVRLLDAVGGTSREVAMRSDDYVRGVAGDAVVVQTLSGGTLVVRPGGVVRVAGDWVELAVDDGSAPGLLLTMDGSTLRAWDEAGDARWQADVTVPEFQALLLEGRVIAGSGTDVVAVDATTGDELWRAGSLLPGSGITTDGRSVLVLAPRPGRSAPEGVVALDARDGDVLWRTTLPESVDSLRSVHGVLVAFTFDEQRDGGWPVVTVLG